MAKKETKAINNPHDKMFKSVLSKKEEAEEFLKHALPASMSDKLDYSNLELSPDSYVSTELNEYFSDIVYSCPYKVSGKNINEIKISLLFEHKSYPEDFPHLQVLTYQIEAWRQQVANDAKKLQPIIPIIFYHGEQEWKVKTFDKYFTFVDEFIRQAIPSFSYHLLDTKHYDNDKVFNSFEDSPFKAYFLLAKNIRNQKKLVSLLKKIFQIRMNFTSESHEKGFIRLLIYYLFDINDEEIKQKLREIMETTTYAKDFVSIADSYRNEGMKEGMDKGINIGMDKGIDIAMRVYALIAGGVDNAQISELTKMSESKIQELRMKFMPSN